MELEKDNLIYSKEKTYFIICLVISILAYLILTISIVGILFVGLLAICGWITHGVFVGNLNGNAVKISKDQFPEAYEIIDEYSLRMGLKKIPTVYILQTGGFLNAFATRFVGRNIVVIYSEMFELAYENGKDALTFILCHELAHIKRNHSLKDLFLFPAFLVPFLGNAYYRACEYTCDRIANHFCQKGSVDGLLILAAGKKLYKKINILEFEKQLSRDGGVWEWLAEIFSTHPHLSNRLREIDLQMGPTGSIVKQSIENLVLSK